MPLVVALACAGFGALCAWAAVTEWQRVRGDEPTARLTEMLGRMTPLSERSLSTRLILRAIGTVLLVALAWMFVGILTDGGHGGYDKPLLPGSWRMPLTGLVSAVVVPAMIVRAVAVERSRRRHAECARERVDAERAREREAGRGQRQTDG